MITVVVTLHYFAGNVMERPTRTVIILFSRKNLCFLREEKKHFVVFKSATPNAHSIRSIIKIGIRIAFKKNHYIRLISFKTCIKKIALPYLISMKITNKKDGLNFFFYRRYLHRNTYIMSSYI